MEAKAKRKLQDLLLKNNLTQKFTAEQVLGIFGSEKYTFEKQKKFLGNLYKPYVLDFDKHSALFEVNVEKNKKSPLESFIIFVNSVTMAPQKPQIATKPTRVSDSKLSTRSEFESPALSSTRLDTPEVVVSEVTKVLRSANRSCRWIKSLFAGAVTATAYQDKLLVQRQR